jgi:hypothetical protein
VQRHLVGLFVAEKPGARESQSAIHLQFGRKAAACYEVDH